MIAEMKAGRSYADEQNIISFNPENALTGAMATGYDLYNV